MHQAPFEGCCETFAELRAEGRSGSLLLYGEPGNGKSHLLAHLVSLFSQANDSNDFLTAQGWTFATVNLQFVQTFSWRQLQVSFANDLLRITPSGLTQLERLLLCRLTHYGIAEGDCRLWLEKLRKDARSVTAFASYLEDIFEALDSEELMGADMRKVLRYLLLGFHSLQASAWLRGEALPAAVLEHLGLQRLPHTEEELEAHAQRVVLALCLLITPQLPLVLCFDQVEALQQDPDDAQGLDAFLEIFQTLRQHARCTLLVASTQSKFRDPLRKALRQLEVSQNSELVEIWLAPLTWREAQNLIKLRLDSVPALARMREDRTHNHFWPLEEADILTAIGFQARQLFVHCAMLYEQSRPAGTSGALQLARNSGQLSSGRLSGHLSGRLAAHLSGQFPSGALHPKEHAQYRKLWLERYEHHLPLMHEDDRFDERLPRCLKTLVRFARSEWKIRNDELPRDVDVLFEREDGNVHLTLCNHSHLPSYNKRVQRILERFYGHRTYELVLLRDARRTFGPMSRTPRKLREAIIDRGAHWVDVTPEMQAALETLDELCLASERGDQGSRGVAEWAVTTPVDELKFWLETIFPDDALELVEEDYITGKLPSLRFD